MSLGKEEGMDFLLPKGLSGKTFADISKKLGKESEERELDSISKRGKDSMLDRLANAQEHMREDPNNLFAQGGKLFRMGGLLSSPNKDSFGKKVDDVDPFEVSIGTKTEMEHTNNPRKAKQTALDHLKEDPMYYTKLYGQGLASEKLTQIEMEEIDSRMDMIRQEEMAMQEQMMMEQEQMMMGQMPQQEMPPDPNMEQMMALGGFLRGYVQGHNRIPNEFNLGGNLFDDGGDIKTKARRHVEQEMVNRFGEG